MENSSKFVKLSGLNGVEANNPGEDSYQVIRIILLHIKLSNFI